MTEYRIAVVAGDGIGPEVMAECKKVLTAAAELDGGFRFAFTDFPWGCQYYLKTGQMMPEDGIEILRGYDAILLGAVGYPGVPDNISLRDLLIRIRHDFDQYINPCADMTPSCWEPWATPEFRTISLSVTF